MPRTFDGMKPNIFLSYNEKILINAAINNYVAEIRKACLEDQGIPQGEPNTLGFELQIDYEQLKKKITRTIM